MKIMVVGLSENGLHSEHITQYEQELRDMVEDKHHSEKQKIRELQKDNKKLHRELRKKEKALAEMAALYTLKKKQRSFGGKRGRLIPEEMRKMAVELIEEAHATGTGLRNACDTLEISVSSYRRWRSGKYRDNRKGAVKHVS